MNDAEVQRKAFKVVTYAEGVRVRAERVRHLNQQLEGMTAARDYFIREWWETEHPPLRAIGEAAGLSHTAIANILKKGQT